MRWALALGWFLPACAKDPQPAENTCGENDVCVLAGTGELGFNEDGLPYDETRLASPSAVYESPDGLPIIVDYSNMRVRTVDPEDGTIRTLVGNGFHAYSELGTHPHDTPLENPIDIGWNTDGHLCVLPQHEGRVVCVENDEITAFAGTGEIADGGDDGPAVDATMGYGGGMVFADDGTLYISDTTHSRIRRVSTDGTIDTVLGIGEGGATPLGFGPETAIRFPERLALSEDNDRLFVADTYNNRVLALDTETLEVSLIAGTGEAGFSGDDGDATSAQLNLPVGVTAGPDNSVLIADTRNHVIRHVDSDGTIRTVVGTGSTTLETVPQPPLQFAVLGPAGLSWNENGDLLIAEQWGHRILFARNLWGAL